MIRRRPSGKYGIGVSMSNGPWFERHKLTPDHDPDGSGISDHIQQVRTKVCQFSDTKGSGVCPDLNGVKVQSSGPGYFMTFHIQDA